MSVQTTTINPYVGPRPFTILEKDRFYGRDAEANYLIPLVISERLVLFYAQSGAGKSSLINARLIPGLEARNFIVMTGRISGQSAESVPAANIFMYNLLASLEEVRPEGVEAAAAPKADPARLANMTLAQYLADLDIEPEIHQEAEEARETAAGDGGAPARLLVDAPQVVSGVRPIALIIDQFEEIFTTNLGAWKHREPFFRQIREAMEEDPYLWVVLTLREDYVAALDPYADLLPGYLRARFYMQRMGSRSALEAVKRPVESLRPFEQDAAEELVRNLSLINVGKDRDGAPVYEVGPFVEPVQLQVVCYQLWEQLKDTPGTSITINDLKSLAGGQDLATFITEALGNFYEQAVQDVLKLHPQLSERRLRDWFSRELITEAETRSAVRQGAESTGSLPNDVVKSLQDRFIIRGEIRGGNTWYELSHDRFVAPILQANRAWGQQNPRPIQSAVQAWLEANRDPAKLLEGKQLTAALALLRDHPDELTDDEQEFLRASQEAADARQRKRQRLVMGIFALAVVVLVVLLIFAGLGWTRADQLRGTAESARMMEAQQRQTAVKAQSIESDLRGQADTARKTAEVARSTAEVASTQAIQQKDVADVASTQAIDQKNKADVASTQALEQKATAEVASTLAVEQKQIADRLNEESQASRLASLADYYRESDLGLSSLLAIQAVNVSTHWEPRRALMQDVQRGLLNQVARDGIPIFTDQNPTSLAYSPDGTLAAAGLSNGEVRLWQLGANSSQARINTDFFSKFPVSAVAFDASSTYLASADVSGMLHVWNMKTNEVWQHNPYPPESFTFYPITSLAFQPGGDWLAVASDAQQGGTGRVFLYNIKTGKGDTDNKNLLRSDCGQYSCTALAWSQDGSHLAVGNSGGSIRILELVKNSELRELRTLDKVHNDGVKGLAWYPDGQRLVSGGLDRHIYQWDVGKTRELLHETSYQDTPIVTGLALSPNGRFLLVGGSDPNTPPLISLWDGDTLARIPNDIFQNTHRGGITAVTFNAAGDRFAVASRDFFVSLWKFVPVNPLGKLVYAVKNSGTTEALGQNASGALMLVQSVGGDQVNVWTEKTADPARFSAPHRSLVLAKLNGQPALVTGGTGGDVSFLNPQGGAPLRDPLKLAAGTLRSLALSADEKYLAASVCQGTESKCDLVVLQNLADGSKPVQVDLSKYQPGIITALAFNEDSSKLAIGSSEGQIFAYEISTAKLTQGVTSGAGAQRARQVIASLAYSPAEVGLLAAGLQDGGIALWEAATLDPIDTYAERMNGAVNSLFFRKPSTDAAWVLVSASANAEVRQWEIDLQGWIQRACQIARRNLTPEEKQRYLFPGIKEFDPCK